MHKTMVIELLRAVRSDIALLNNRLSEQTTRLSTIEIMLNAQTGRSTANEVDTSGGKQHNEAPDFRKMSDEELDAYIAYEAELEKQAAEQQDLSA